VADAILEVKELSIDYPIAIGTVRAVRGVSFMLYEGEVLGLVGESGCGKSTLGLSILRLLRAPGRVVQGELLFRGRDILQMKNGELRRLRGANIAMVFQNPLTSLDPLERIRDHFLEALAVHEPSLSKQEGLRRAGDILERLGIERTRLDEYPHQLSGGQTQRVVLARALITNPEFLVADEPIAMADVSVRAMILELMRKLKDELNLTYLFITHDLATAKYLCDRVAIMYLGRIVEIGSRDQLFRRPHHPYTKALLQAVPVPDPSKRRTEPVAKGEIPSAVKPPSGCHFHPRCPYATGKCRQDRPPLAEIEAGHLSACILD